MLQRSVRRVATRAQRGFAAAVQVDKVQPQSSEMPSSSTSIEQMKKSKHDFVHFINNATLDPSSEERKELYKFLVQCFVDNDTDYDGEVSYRGFCAMIAESALAPRRFGFAPHTRDLFSSKEEYDLQRVSMYKELCSGTDKKIKLEGWLNWAMPHIKEKVGSGLVEHKEARWERSKEDFVSFCKGIAKEKSSLNTKSKSSTQYKEFYMMNCDVFKQCDTEKSGLLNERGLNNMLSKLDAVPKKWGLDFGYSNVKMSDITDRRTATWAEMQAFQVKLVTEKAKAM